MKVIDLLNKIANGEEVPEKIKYKNSIYNWNKNAGNYIDEKDENVSINWDYVSMYGLNDEVAIIEDKPIKDKEIEKIIYIGYGEDGNMQYELASKLNEVIDAVNKLNKK